MFRHYISLGCFCGTASAMSKYGLRSFSGPFDWCVSSLSGILHFMENNFTDFLCRENLKVADEYFWVFEDTKYNIRFLHDVKYDFGKEYSFVCQKYAHRIARFQDAVSNSTCFIRAVSDPAELTFIQENRDYIFDILKWYCPDNEIIYLIPRSISVPDTFREKYFILQTDSYSTASREALRDFFDTSKDLIAYCTKNYDETTRKDNLLFDLSHENKALQIFTSRYQQVLKICRADLARFDLPPELDIYGAGNIGKIFYDKIKGICRIGCFIDLRPREKTYDNIPILRIADYTARKDIPIIVTPIYEEDEIRENLISCCHVNPANILSLGNILS